MVVRFFMFQAHYRSIVDISETALKASEKGFNRLLEGITKMSSLTTSEKSSGFDLQQWKSKCYAAMNDDFNSPILIAQLFDAVRFINAVKNEIETISVHDQGKLSHKMHEFVEDIMGILLDGSENQTALSTALEGTVSMLIDIRKAARDNNDFATSDRIRDELLALGVQLKDGKDGTGFSL